MPCRHTSVNVKSIVRVGRLLFHLPRLVRTLLLGNLSSTLTLGCKQEYPSVYKSFSLAHCLLLQEKHIIPAGIIFLSPSAFLHRYGLQSISYQ